MEIDEPKDDEDELAAFMAASTTVRKRRLEVGPTINPKRRKQLKDLAVLASTDDACQKEQEQNFAANYFIKLKEQIEPAAFEKVLKLLSDFDGTSEGVMNLFLDVSSVLPPSLAKEFLCFLTPDQAHLCGKFMEHLTLSKMIEFFRKFEICFPKQPQMVRKFYDVLCQLASSENVSLQQVRDAVLPLLKSKSFLLEYFLQLFPTEKPSDSFVLDDYEDIYIDADCGLEEEIRLAETEDSANCPCSCHPSHATHCQRCAVKYINGRVYIQTGKVLRTARVEFNGFNPLDALRRVCVNSEELTPKAKPTRRKPDIHNQKDLSPIKHVSSPHNMATTESEDESLEVKSSNVTNKPKSARSLKIKFKSSDKLLSKSKQPRTQEGSEELKITDENAITDLPDCFLTGRLSPIECSNRSSLNFNNILSDSQNHSNSESTLNFSVHSPLKRASICLDGFDSTSESMQSPIKIDHRLCIPLKRVDEEDMLMTVQSKDNHNISIETVNSSSDRSGSEIFKLDTPMKSDISGTVDTVLTSSDVDEMNAFLGSSNMDKINAFESNFCESAKNSQKCVEKYPEPAMDSISIDSFLNISNLDAKIDSFLTNAEGSKNLAALLDDSSPESSNMDKDSNTKESVDLSQSEKVNNYAADIPEVSIKSSMNLSEPVSKVVRNMDSILDLIDHTVPESTSPVIFAYDSSERGSDSQQAKKEVCHASDNILSFISTKKEEISHTDQKSETSSIINNAQNVKPRIVHNMDSILELIEDNVPEKSDPSIPEIIKDDDNGVKPHQENSGSLLKKEVFVISHEAQCGSPKKEDESVKNELKDEVLDLGFGIEVLPTSSELVVSQKTQCVSPISPILRSLLKVPSSKGDELVEEELKEEVLDPSYGIEVLSTSSKLQVSHKAQFVSPMKADESGKEELNGELKEEVKEEFDEEVKEEVLDISYKPEALSTICHAEKCKSEDINGMDIILDLIGKVPKTEHISLAPNGNLSHGKNSIKEGILPDADQGLLSPKSENGSVKDEAKEELPEGGQTFEASSVSSICSILEPKCKKVDSLLSTPMFDGNKLDPSEIESSNSAHFERELVRNSLILTQSDAVQSVSFICGKEGDENLKVTLFSANSVEEKINDTDVLPIATNLTTEEGCIEQTLLSNRGRGEDSVKNSSRVLHGEKFSEDGNSTCPSDEGTSKVPARKNSEDVSEETEKVTLSTSEVKKIVRKNIPVIHDEFVEDQFNQEISSPVSRCVSKKVLTTSDVPINFIDNIEKNGDPTFNRSTNISENEESSHIVRGSSKDFLKRSQVRLSDSIPVRSSVSIQNITGVSKAEPADSQRIGPEKEKSSSGLSANLMGGQEKDSVSSPAQMALEKQQCSKNGAASTEKTEKLMLGEHDSQSRDDRLSVEDAANANEDVGSKTKDQGNVWTMEEDKVILQTFKKDPDMQDIFSKIQTQLSERTLEEVQSRFYVLIELLEKMSHSSEGASKKE